MLKCESCEIKSPAKVVGDSEEDLAQQNGVCT